MPAARQTSVAACWEIWPTEVHPNTQLLMIPPGRRSSIFWRDVHIPDPQRRSSMNKRLFLFGVFLVSSIVLMAAPAAPTWPGDWVERMIADRAAALETATTSDRLPAGDWVERMIAASASAPQPDDWVGRMIADRGRDFASPSLAQIEGVKTALMATGSAKDAAGMR
jgi:hypothetical protein